MKNKILIIYALILVLAIAVRLVQAAPTLSTEAATDINATYATGHGSINDLGGETIVDHGFLWSTEATPVLAPAAPVAHWKMNDNAANLTVADAMGTYNGTSTQNTSAMTATGKLNSALAFNGSSDYVNLGTASELNLTSTYTYAFWLKTSTNGKSVYSGNAAGFGLGILDLNIYDNKLRVTIHSVGHILLSTENVTTGSWLHCAVVRDSGNNWKIYINGSEKGSASSASAPSSWGSKYWGRGYYGYLNGYLDDVRIYDRALASTEIAMLYWQGLGTEESVTTLMPNTIALSATSSTGSFAAPLNFLLPGRTYNYRTYAITSESGIAYGDIESFTASTTNYALWTGASSTDWMTPTNWSTGAVPTSSVEVIINGNYTNAPTLSLASGSTTIKSLSIGATSTSVLTMADNTFSPYAQWKMNDNAASTVVVESVTGLNGVAAQNTSALSTGGKINTAIAFNNTSDYMYVNSPVLPTGNFTYSFWVNFSNVDDETLIYASNGSGGNELAIYNNSTNLSVWLHNTSAIITAPQIATSSEWFHITLTRLGSDVKLYVNGVQTGSTGSYGTALAFSTCPLLIGTDGDSGCNASLGNWLGGSIDDLRVYKYALKESQIAELYNSGNGTETQTFRYGLKVEDNAAIGNYGTLTHATNSSFHLHDIKLNVVSLSVASGGKIDVNSKGYPGATGAGAGLYNISNPSGASYGGTGESRSIASVSTYGSTTEPYNLGSGGGNSLGGTGASGGGMIEIFASETANISGVISANGGGGSVGWGDAGGSGGSVRMSAGTISGNGIISVFGGNGRSSVGIGGGGGGGRIATYYTTDNSSIAYHAYGGSGSSFAGAGTIYKKPLSQSYGNLIIDNNDQSSEVDRYIGRTEINNALTLNTLTIQNYGNFNVTTSTDITYSTLNWSTKGVITDSGGSFALFSGTANATIPSTSMLVSKTTVPRTFDNLIINGILTHAANSNTSDTTYKLDYTITGDMEVANGGQINVNYKGYEASAGIGTGNSGLGAGGAGYGGSGGAGGFGVGGIAYGSLTEPFDPGSGGGQYNLNYPGGAGGGTIKLSVSGTTTIASGASVIANGQNYIGINGGGGSGGSIWLITDTLSGSGTVSAIGGNGYPGSGGGGGGGRVAIYYTTNNSAITYQAYGGNGYVFAGAGTIYKKPSSQSYGNLVIDNNNQEGWDDRYIGRTEINDTMTLDTLTIQNYGNFNVTTSTDITYSTLNWSTKGVITDNGGTLFLVSNNQDLIIPVTSRLVGNISKTFSSLTINGVLTHSSNTTTTCTTYRLDYTITGDTEIASSGQINVSYKGYETNAGIGSGGGGGLGAGGAGHGGVGGAGSINAGGIMYGSSTEPFDLGSGGGQYNLNYPGGAGGGTIKLNVSGTTTISSGASVIANGQNYQDSFSGGGSGGSIWLITDTLSGSGTVSAIGGNGYPGSGGGGGGGRIALIFNANNSAFASISVAGGTGYTAGSSGTIYPTHPTISTQDASDVVVNTATGNGSISQLGIHNINEYGHVWSSASSVPYIVEPHSELGATSTIGAFASSLTSLVSGTTYYYRAYAQTSDGTVTYGNVVSFETLSGGPITLIGFPLNNSYQTAVNSIYGTNQPTFGTCEAVRISIKDEVRDQWWDGNGFDASSEDWQNVTGTTTWAYDSSGISWENNKNYLIRASSTNSLGLSDLTQSSFIKSEKVPEYIFRGGKFDFKGKFKFE